MRKLLLISTGGTIASTITTEGFAPSISADEMLNYLNDLGNGYQINTYELINIDSTNIQPEHWVEMTACIEENYPFYDGFIITHGTDTMAYTAAALSYMIQNIKKPIIVTGAQRPINMDTTDAKKNLKDAITYALCEGVSGVYIVFDGKAILGTRARKTKTKSFDAFESINYPIAAFIDGTRVARYVRSEVPVEDEVFYKEIYPNIFLLKLAPGMQPDVLDYIGEKYEGIVIESYGAGGLPFEDRRNFLEKMGSLTSNGRIVVITSQVMSEGSDMALYEVGMKALKRYNVLEALDMTLESVLTKMMWIMGQTKKYDDVKNLFYKRISNDIMYYH